MDEDQPKGLELWFGKPLALFIFFIGLPWAFLTLSSQGFLISAEEYTSRFGDESIRCTYFIGVRTVTITHMTFHMPECPVFETITE